MDVQQLWDDQSEFSQSTFGRDAERGPIGPLKHLAREAQEAVEAYAVFDALPVAVTDAAMHAMFERRADFETEMADCLILVFDAARRGGMSLDDLIGRTAAKLAVNKARTWPKPGDPNEPVMHVK